VESYLLVRLSKQDKSDLFDFAKDHQTTASELVRQFIRGSIKPNAPRLVSTRSFDSKPEIGKINCE
jgi:hypothetical protein